MTRIESDGSINTSGNITATGSIVVGGQTGGAILEADAANTLAQRNGTNAQAFNIYNTYSDASNYERLKIGWYGNDAIIGTEKAGTGSARTLQFQIAGMNRLEITGTWIDLRGSCRPDTNGTRHFGYSTNRWAIGWFDQLDQEILTSTDVGHILKGAASQSADLAQYQNSAGTVMTRIESDGSINTSGNITASGTITARATLLLVGQ
jgi:hypothetical protein